MTDHSVAGLRITTFVTLLLATMFLASAALAGASAISLTVNVIEERPAVGIWLNNAPPDPSATVSDDPISIKVVNVGSSSVNLAYDVDNRSSEPLSNGFTIDGDPWYTYSRVIAPDETIFQRLSVEGELSSDLAAPEGSVTIWANVDWSERPPIVDWTSFQGDNNLGLSGHRAPISDADLLWTVDLGSSVMGTGLDSAILCADGKIFAVNWAGEVYAIDNATGDVLWSVKSIAPRTALGFELSTPAYDDGVLYVALNRNTSDNGFSVHAIDCDEGMVLWSERDFGTGNAQPNTPIEYSDGMIYLGIWPPNGSAGTYYCLNATDGSLIWSRPSSTGGGYYWAGAAIVGDNLVYGDFRGNVSSVDKRTGETVEEISLSAVFRVPVGGICSSIAYSPETGRIYLTDRGGYCYALGYDSVTGHFDTSSKWATEIGLSTCTPAVYGGKVYVGTGAILEGDPGSGFYCLRESDGDILWKYADATEGSDAAFGIIQSSAVISTYYDNGDDEVYVYFTTNVLYGSVYCLDGNGGLMWRFIPSDEQCEYVLQGVVVHEGKVYYGNDQGILFALGGG